MQRDEQIFELIAAEKERQIDRGIELCIGKDSQPDSRIFQRHQGIIHTGKHTAIESMKVVQVRHAQRDRFLRVPHPLRPAISMTFEHQQKDVPYTFNPYFRKIFVPPLLLLLFDRYQTMIQIVERLLRRLLAVHLPQDTFQPALFDNQAKRRLQHLPLLFGPGELRAPIM